MINYEAFNKVASEYRGLISESVPESALDARDKVTVGIRADLTGTLHSVEDELSHLIWMLDEISTVPMGDQKMMRWLCFIQGVLWSQDLISIEHAMKNNREILSDEHCPECARAKGIAPDTCASCAEAHAEHWSLVARGLRRTAEYKRNHNS